MKNHCKCSLLSTRNHRAQNYSTAVTAQGDKHNPLLNISHCTLLPLHTFRILSHVACILLQFLIPIMLYNSYYNTKVVLQHQ